MKLPPVAILLTWPTPNYDHPETRGRALIITDLTFLVLITIAVVLRLYSRQRIQKWLGLDDIFIGISVILSLGLGVVLILANLRYDWDRHIWDIRMSAWKGASIISFVAKILYSLSATFTRISFICYYFRLVRDTGSKKFKTVLWLSMAWQVAVCIVFVCLSIFDCTPVDAYWTFSKAFTARCVDEGSVVFAGSCINCFSDLMVTLLPIPIIMRLRLPMKQRIGVSFLLSLGITATIAGSLRTYYVYIALVDTYDATWNSYPVWICSAVEVYLAVICSCIPALKPLVKIFIDHIRTRVRDMRFSHQRHSIAETLPTDIDTSSKGPAALQIADISLTSSPHSSQAVTLYGDEESNIGYTG